MLKSITMSASVALSVTAWLLLPLHNEPALAQSGPFLVNAVEYDVVPGQVDNFVAALKENGAASVKEPGCREFNVSISQKDPNHVLIYEVYNDAAAAEAHTATDHFKKYKATTAGMTTKREAKSYSSVSMNMKGM
ncbi:MAG TPA: antibiotic biosynthesis monooxygenase [Xanthobacteraceae bacterium]|jgi:quinol monooxygenase YgiN